LDREGAFPAGTTHGLLRFTNSRWEKVGKEWGFFVEQAGNLFVDKKGNLWLNGNTDLYRLSPDAHVFQMRKLRIDGSFAKQRTARFDFWKRGRECERYPGHWRTQPIGLLGNLAAMTCGWRDFEGRFGSAGRARFRDGSEAAGELRVSR
jgi:hypothetical protein